MKVVYSLKEYLLNNPRYVADVQARTLDNRDLPGGLKGTYGLFGTDEWWRNIESGVIPVTTLTGVIVRLYREGMDNGQGFEMTLADGSLFKWSCVCNRRKDLKRYQVGKTLSYTFATEPLKNPVERAGSVETEAHNTLEIAVEE